MITCTCGFINFIISILAKTFLSRIDCWGFEDGKVSPKNEKTCGQLPTLSSLPLHPSNRAWEVQLNSCKPFKVAQNKEHHSYLLLQEAVFTTRTILLATINFCVY